MCPAVWRVSRQRGAATGRSVQPPVRLAGLWESRYAVQAMPKELRGLQKD